MTKRWKLLAWGATIVGGLTLVGLGAYLTHIGLDRADKLASVIGAFVGLVGLGMSAYGAVLTRRGSVQSPPSSPGAQTVNRVNAGRDVDVVDSIAGDVRLGRSSPPASRQAPASVPRKAAGPLGEQSVTNVRARGNIRVVRGVGGDLDITS